MKTKKEIRNTILSMRRAMDEETVALASQVICRKIIGIKEYEEADDVCLYVPINNEVDVMLMADIAVEEGKRVWIPKVVSKGEGHEAGDMVFTRYEGCLEDTIPGAYQIPESKSQEVLEPSEKTVVIMPGAVFTPWRDRIGYGGGYYDKFLEKNPQCSTIAACYDIQIVDEIPVEEFDRKPDYVVSERSIYR